MSRGRLRLRRPVGRGRRAGLLGGGVAIGMSECEVVQRLGQPNNVNLGQNPNGSVVRSCPIAAVRVRASIASRPADCRKWTGSSSRHAGGAKSSCEEKDSEEKTGSAAEHRRRRQQRIGRALRRVIVPSPHLLIYSVIKARGAKQRTRAERGRAWQQITHRTVTANGIQLHLAEQGEGPVVVLCHGFPESWYSWRHQLAALADAGFHAVAPDMRGYGGLRPA